MDGELGKRQNSLGSSTSAFFFSFSSSPAICTSFRIPFGSTLTNNFHHEFPKDVKIQPLS